MQLLPNAARAIIYGGREGQFRVARYHLRRRCDSVATSLRHRCDVAPTSLRRRSDVAATSLRRRCDSAATSLRQTRDALAKSLRRRRDVVAACTALLLLSSHANKGTNKEEEKMVK